MDPEKACRSEYEYAPGKSFKDRECPFLRETSDGVFNCLRTEKAPDASCPVLGDWAKQVDAWNENEELVDEHGEVDLFTGSFIVDCPSCYQEVLECDLDYCSECGQEICEYCMNESEEDPDAILCDECFEEDDDE